MSASIEQAERAKQQICDLLAGVPGVNGIGIAALDDGYGVKVNLRTPDARAAIPKEIGGVRIIVEVIGAISAY